MNFSTEIQISKNEIENYSICNEIWFLKHTNYVIILTILYCRMHDEVHGCKEQRKIVHLIINFKYFLIYFKNEYQFNIPDWTPFKIGNKHNVTTSKNFIFHSKIKNLW